MVDMRNKEFSKEELEEEEWKEQADDEGYGCVIFRKDGERILVVGVNE